MFNKKYEIIICVDKDYVTDMEIIINNIKTKGIIDIYVDDNKAYIRFTTKFTTDRVIEIIERRLYKSKTKNVCGIIFTEMK